MRAMRRVFQSIRAQTSQIQDGPIRRRRVLRLWRHRGVEARSVLRIARCEFTLPRCVVLSGFHFVFVSDFRGGGRIFGADLLEKINFVWTLCWKIVFFYFSKCRALRVRNSILGYNIRIIKLRMCPLMLFLISIKGKKTLCLCVLL